MNHSALLTGDQIDALREETGLAFETEWDAFDDESAEGRICASAARRLVRPPATARAPIACPRDALDDRPGQDVDAGRVRAGAARALPGRRRRRPHRDALARRLRVHEPGRLDQQGRDLGRAGARARLRPPRGLAARLARPPRRPPYRARHLRDEPFPAPRAARAVRRPFRRAALPGRHGLRPVRRARPRGAPVLRLLGLALRVRRHALGPHALARGRRSPVDDHAWSRDRASGPPLRGALLRPRDGVAPAPRSREPAGARGRGALPSTLDEADRAGAVRRAVRQARRRCRAGRRPRRRLPAPGAVRLGRARGARHVRRDGPRRRWPQPISSQTTRAWTPP